MLVLLCRAATAQNVEFRQISAPPGVVNQTTYPVLGSTVSTVTAPATSSNYSFTHWTVNGLRMNDGTGSGINPAVFVVPDAVESVANYTLTAQDSDADSLADWYEIHYFGDLSQGPNDDFDGDGFTNAQEIYYNQHPGAFDSRVMGGVSRRRGLVQNVAPDVGDPAYLYGGVSRRRSASTLVIENPSLVSLTEVSSPVGILAQTRVLNVGDTVNLSTAPTPTSGYRFTGWIVDGVRFDKPPQNQPIPITMTHNTNAVARYILEALDSDADGIPDWIEWYNYNGLQYNLNSDPDGDGLSWAVETFRGYSVLAADTLDMGGVSRRRSATLEVDTQGRVIYRLTSDPPTILEQSQRVLPGTLLTVPDRTNNTAANYKFAWWDLNGTRQADPSGASLNQFSFVISTSSTATAHYVDPTVDTDADGILDWNERYYYGTLAYNGSSDTDGDGFTYAQEVYYGQSPLVTDFREQGGVSRRRGVVMGVNAILLNVPPVVATGAAAPVTTTTATLNGLVNPIGSATTVYFEWALLGSSYDHQTVSQDVGTGLLSVGVSSFISGLTPDTDYHLRIVATNARGTTSGDDVIFHTRVPGYAEWAAGLGVGGSNEDDDHDGLPNLLEWALNLNPTTPSRLPATAARNGANLEFTYTRSLSALHAGTAYSVEWSDTLSNDWQSTGVSETILSDNGTVQQVKATIPAGSGSRRFAHLKVTGPP